MTARAERVLPPVLLGLTAVTGLVDAVSYLALGHVFTANMTGNAWLLGYSLALVLALCALVSAGCATAAFVGVAPDGRAG